MINIIADVFGTDDNFKAMRVVMKELENTQVLVGIPEDKSAREDGQITNAGLLYIHSNGSPINNIPARPVIEPALEQDKECIGKVMGDAVKAAMDGNSAGMRQNLDKAGMAGQSAAKGYFTDPSNGFAPLSDARRKQKEKKGSNAERPLIDTSDLRNSITYVVRKKT